MGYKEILINKLGIFLLPKVFALVSRKLREKFSSQFHLKYSFRLFSFWLVMSLFHSPVLYVHLLLQANQHPFLMEHTSHINKIILTFVLVPGKVVDATLRISEEKRHIRIQPSSKDCSSINISMKDGHIEFRYPVSIVDNYSKIYNCWVQQPIFLPSCPVWPSLWISVSTMMPKWPFETYKASKAAYIFSCISPGCHSILHDTEWQNWSILYQPNLLNFTILYGHSKLSFLFLHYLVMLLLLLICKAVILSIKWYFSYTRTEYFTYTQ